MVSLDIEALGARAEAMIGELSAISAEPTRLVRLFLSPEHRRASDLVARWMSEAKLEVFEDALGTVRGKLKGYDRGPTLLIGSHIDTVIDAGKYDGTLGVVAGIIAAEHIGRSCRRPPFNVEVVAFGDEEGSRFPSTLNASAACAGAFAPAALESCDRDGITIAAALKAYGKDADLIASAAYKPDDIAAYIEVHIEQGPVLEAENLSLGVVTAIVGQSRERVRVGGEAGHAGTVPMALRRDAMTGAAEIIGEIERIARKNFEAAMVATVGSMAVYPGAVNIIPSAVEFTVDLRSINDAVRRAAIAEMKAVACRIAQRRRLSIEFESLLDIQTVACEASLQERLSRSIEAIGCRSIRLPSGAIHDAQMMAQLCPSAMLFVRCRNGISHNPSEYADPRDMGRAIAALVQFILEFDLKAHQ